MSEPIWIFCGSITEVEPHWVLSEKARDGRHVVLVFSPALEQEVMRTLMMHLSEQLSDHTVFDSGGDSGRSQITISPVVARSAVLERQVLIRRAIEEYCLVRKALVEQYRAKVLSREWKTAPHGGHIMFQHRRTGQTVEAAYQAWADADYVDPFFFARFVESTQGYEAVAELLGDKYHDAARMLLIVTEEAA